MMMTREPEPAWLESWLGGLEAAPLSYAHRGGVEAPPGAGFLLDVHLERLGHGEAAFARACAALDAWRMFPAWARVMPEGRRPEVGRLVAMVVRICGLWWVNPCRVLRRVDGMHEGVRRHGFVYGTLAEHSECGEERFMVELRADGSVWYEIRAFSRPRHWMAWAGFPLARWWQLRFGRDSRACMKAVVAGEGGADV